MYDLIIIGSGPAGISAALSAKARNLDFIWFGSNELSTKIQKAEKIMNYPGLCNVSGEEMQRIFRTQIKEMQLEIKEERVDAVYDMGKYYIACVNDKMYEGKSLILALGVAGVKEIPGETEFLGKGVSYCATCDGALYKEKKIAVICTDSSQEDEIEYLAELAGQVIVFTNYKGFHVEKQNITHYVGYPERIEGDERVQAVICGGEKTEVDGVFCLKASVSPAILLKGLKTENGHIIVDRLQCTNMRGCFAAGDCTGRPYQYVKAAGEGNVALHSAVTYLQSCQEEK